jgi:hypothetical protein
MTSLLTKLFYFVIATSNKYAIDETHGLRHSMDILRFTHEIFQSELPMNSWLAEQERLIYVSAIIHDMCDKKYMDENEGIARIEEFLKDKLHNSEITATKQIISTMSYSKVKKVGFPDLGRHQHAYHIVREADLLTAYDFERCMMYNIRQQEGNILGAFDSANTLFENRVLKHMEDGLLLTDYARTKASGLHLDAVSRINTWKQLIKNPSLL